MAGKGCDVNRSKKKSYRIDYVGYVYVAPAMLVILFCSLIPIIMSLYYSFHNFNVVNPPVFVGLKNYQKMFTDPFMGASIINTTVLVLLVVPLQTVFAIFFAAIITSRKRSVWTGFVKSAMFIPVVSSMTLVGTVWKIMLAANGGLINLLIGLVGIEQINWLGNKRLALTAICIVTVWKNIGYFMVIYIAGMMDIPKDYYEAATVDGAGKVSQFFYITLPVLKPVNFLVLTLGTIWSFQTFDAVYVMTSGGPGTATTTMVVNIYNVAFKSFQMGYGTAIAMVLFVIIMILSALQRIAFAEKEAAL